MLDTIESVKILVAYICVTHGTHTLELASRFVGSYLACPAGVEHSLTIIFNGGIPNISLAPVFDTLECSQLNRDNDAGWDISGYMDLALRMNGSAHHYDAMLCLGESVYFHREGWLKKIVAAWERFGPGMYGFFSSNLICPHLCTTAFACPPEWLAEYPTPTNGRERYQFEHGEHSFWRAMKAKGRTVKLVTWDGVYDPWRWREPKDGLWTGSQSNCLMWCNHTDRYRAQNPRTQRAWERAASAPFR